MKNLFKLIGLYFGAKLLFYIGRYLIILLIIIISFLRSRPEQKNIEVEDILKSFSESFKKFGDLKKRSNNYWMIKETYFK